jgi:outer membrane immunogenic protein
MKKLLLASTALVACVAAAGANAADLPAPVYKAPASAPAYNWTGTYGGLNLGYGWGTADDAQLGPSGDAASRVFWNPAFIAGAAPSRFQLAPSGVIGGAQLGYNWQFGTWVWGLEADFQGANITDSQSISTAGGGAFAPGSFSSSQNLDFLGTVRGRVGYTPVDRWLIYATGGLAYGQVNYNLSFNFPGSNDFQSIATSRTDVGWTLGAGLEWALDGKWTAKAEYLYVDLGDRTFASVPGGRAANLATTLSETFENRYSIVRVGLNYKLDWSGPLTARY